MRDLEIRGAGDLLGAEQSGHVAALGFELYVEMLHEVVAELSGQRRLAARPVRVDARVDAYVPAALHRLRGAQDRPAPPARARRGRGRAARARVATEDRYGPLPEPVENLFAIQEAKLKLARLGADYLVFRGGRASVGPVVLGSGELRELRARVDTAVYSHRQARGDVPRRGIQGGARLGRCYAGRAPGGMSRRFPMKRSNTSPDSARRGAACRLRRRQQREPQLERRRRRREVAHHQGGLRRADHAGQAELRQQGRKFPTAGTTDYATLQGQAVTLLVQQAEREAEAASLGIKVSDKDIDKRLAEIKKQYFSGNETKYQAQLKQQGLTDAQVRQDIARS